MQRDDAVEGVIFKWKVGNIGVDVDALPAKAFAGFLQGNHREVHADPVAVVLRVGQVFVILHRTGAGIQQEVT